MGGRAAGGGGLVVPGSSAKGRKGQTEVEVIRDWFVNIFQPVEKTADLVIVRLLNVCLVVKTMFV